MLTCPVSQTGRRYTNSLLLYLLLDNIDGKRHTKKIKVSWKDNQVLSHFTFYSLKYLVLNTPWSQYLEMEGLDKKCSFSLLHSIQGFIHCQHDCQWWQQTFESVCALQNRHVCIQRHLYSTDIHSRLACISSDTEAMKNCKPHFTNSHSRNSLVDLAIV